MSNQPAFPTLASPPPMAARECWFPVARVPKLVKPVVESLNAAVEQLNADKKAAYESTNDTFDDKTHGITCDNAAAMILFGHVVSFCEWLAHEQGVSLSDVKFSQSAGTTERKVGMARQTILRYFTVFEKADFLVEVGRHRRLNIPEYCLTKQGVALAQAPEYLLMPVNIIADKRFRTIDKYTYAGILHRSGALSKDAQKRIGYSRDGAGKLAKDVRPDCNNILPNVKQSLKRLSAIEAIERFLLSEGKDAGIVLTAPKPPTGSKNEHVADCYREQTVTTGVAIRDRCGSNPVQVWEQSVTGMGAIRDTKGNMYLPSSTSYPPPPTLPLPPATGAGASPALPEQPEQEAHITMSENSTAPQNPAQHSAQAHEQSQNAHAHEQTDQANIPQDVPQDAQAHAQQANNPQDAAQRALPQEYKECAARYNTTIVDKDTLQVLPNERNVDLVVTFIAQARQRPESPYPTDNSKSEHAFREIDKWRTKYTAMKKRGAKINGEPIRSVDGLVVHNIKETYGQEFMELLAENSPLRKEVLRNWDLFAELVNASRLITGQPVLIACSSCQNTHRNTRGRGDVWEQADAFKAQVSNEQGVKESAPVCNVCLEESRERLSIWLMENEPEQFDCESLLPSNASRAPSDYEQRSQNKLAEALSRVERAEQSASPMDDQQFASRYRGVSSSLTD